MTELVRYRPSNQARSVLIVIPCLNEEEHIERVIDSLLVRADDIPLRLVVADGGSTDATRAIVERIAEYDYRVVLIDNPKRIQSAAVNEAVRQFGDQTQFLLRADAHAEYPEGYCARLLAVQANKGADSVVVTMRTKGHTCFQRAAAAAQNSILGNGGSSHRNATRGRWVEHGHHALMTLGAFSSVGGYDETFTHNEDAELDVRLKEAGFRIFLTGDAPIVYYPRRTAVALFHQYFKTGRGRARNFLKHGRNTKLRHVVLAVVAPAICLLPFAAENPILAFPAIAWAALCLSYGLLLGIRLRDTCAAAAGVAAIISQSAWSFGFVSELIAAPIRMAIGKLNAPPPVEAPSSVYDTDKVES